MGAYDVRPCDAHGAGGYGGTALLNLCALVSNGESLHNSHQVPLQDDKAFYTKEIQKNIYTQYK